MPLIIKYFIRIYFLRLSGIGRRVSGIGRMFYHLVDSASPRTVPRNIRPASSNPAFFKVAAEASLRILHRAAGTLPER